MIHDNSATAEAVKLAQALILFGCPCDKAQAMAIMMDKRARQLAQDRNESYEAALSHLLSLMRQGWSAKERGL